MAQGAKHLPYKPEDQGSDPQNLCKSWEKLSVITGGRDRAPWGKLASSTCSSVDLGSIERPATINNEEQSGKMPQSNAELPHAYMCAHDPRI